MIAISATIAQAFKNLTIRITSSVLFPVFSETHRARPEELKKQLLKSRKYLFLLTFPPYMLLIVLGQPIIALLYDQRYQDAGLYLSIMSVGAALSAVREPFGMALLAVGDSASHTINMSALAFFRVAGMVVGFHAGGVVGMLIADVIAEMCVYPVEAWRLSKHGLWFPRFDLSAFGIYSALGGAVYWLGYT
jgi:O-antigen/teichoic acid export membrane protein